MFGVSKATQTATETDTTPTGSLVGSTDGSVTLSAGQDVHITASDVLSQTGTAIVGQNVTIDAGVGTADSHQSQSLHTGGIMAGLTGGAASKAEQAWASGQRAGQVKDKRLKALYAAQAAYSAYDAYTGASKGATAAGNGEGAKGSAQGSGISLRIGIGASSASAHSDSHDDIAYGSHIRGQNVALAASHNLNLLSQAEQHTQKDSSANARGEVGFSMGSQTGFYATADGGKSRAHGNGTTYLNSSVTANDTLSLISGNDTTIQGAQARGNTVLASVGGNLNLASEQTTDDYASQNWQAGGTFVYGYGSEVHAAAGMVESTYKSVDQVSGIAAGDGGYVISVGGNTDLKGAVIASTADPSRNILSTGTLSFSDLANKARYDAASANVSIGTGTYGSGGSIGMPQHGNESSTTRAGIAQGTIEVRNGPADLSGLDRNPDIDAQGLKTIFDQQKVQERLEMGQVAGQVGMRAAGDIAKYKAEHASTEQEQKAWSDGGAYKTLLHGAVGAAIAALGGGDALQGALGAAASEKASGAMQAYLIEHGYDPNSGKGKALMELASTAIGGAVGGGAGAGTALSGEMYNRQLHDWEHKLAKELAAKSDGQYTWQQIEDAMRNSSYGNDHAPAVDFSMGDNVGKGELYAYTPSGTAEVIMSWSAFSQAGGTLDPGAAFTFPASQNPGLYGYQYDVLGVQTLPALDRGAANFIASHMNDASIQSAYGSHFQSDYGAWQYSWAPEPKPFVAAAAKGYTPQQQGVRGNDATFYDRMLGRVVTIGVSGICGTAECVMKGGNYNMDDPRTQKYLSDVGHAKLKFGATVASFAVGSAWAALAKEAVIPGWMAYSGAGATSAGANAAGQYLTTGTVRAPDVIFAGLTGTYGGWATRLPGWQAPLSMMIVNASGAAGNTAVDNFIYNENHSITDSVFSSSIGSMVGYKTSGYFGGTLDPVYVNLLSSLATEAASRAADKANDEVERIRNENNKDKR